jgi:hypothetical protein
MLLLALALTGCGEEAGDPASQDNVSTNPRSEGALPTHDISLQLLAKDNTARFEHVRLLFEQRGERCGVVLSARLKGGMGGEDEWHVKCADTGEWELWLKPVGHDLVPVRSNAAGPLDH